MPIHQSIAGKNQPPMHVWYLSVHGTFIRNGSQLGNRIGSLSYGLDIVHCHIRQCIAHTRTDLNTKQQKKRKKIERAGYENSILYGIFKTADLFPWVTFEPAVCWGIIAQRVWFMAQINECTGEPKKHP